MNNSFVDVLAWNFATFVTPEGMDKSSLRSRQCRRSDVPRLHVSNASFSENFKTMR